MIKYIIYLSVSLFLSTSLAAAAVPHGQFIGAKETTYPDWFKTSFLDFAEDVSEAAEKGRRVLIIFHQDNCPYCNALVERNLAQRDIEAVLKEKFDVIAINMWGDREIATVDGKVLTEKQFAQALKVQFTPTLLILNESGGLALRLNGYVPPAEFSQALDYAQSHDSPDGYRDFLAQNMADPTSNELVHSDVFKTEKLIFSNSKPMAKPVAVFFEQRDCPACSDLHGKVLQDDETQGLLKQFDAYQVDMWSQQPALQVNGESLSARQWAEKLQIQYAPTMVLFDSSGAEVIRSEALFKRFHTQSMLDYVLSQGYQDEASFQRYLTERADKIRETGRDVDIWND